MCKSLAAVVTNCNDHNTFFFHIFVVTDRSDSAGEMVNSVSKRRWFHNVLESPNQNASFLQHVAT